MSVREMGKDDGSRNSLRIWLQRLSAAGDSGRISAILFIISVLLIAVKSTALWTQPRFFQEEGYIYFKEAWNMGASAVLLKVYAGYLDLSANIPAALATLVSLENAPLITTLCALVFQSIPAAIVAFSRAEYWRTPLRKGLGLVLFITVPMTSEVWLNTTTSKVHLTLAIGLLLLEAKATYGWGRQLAFAVLSFLSGLSSPMPCFLLPFTLLSAFQARTRCAFAIAGGLLSATLIQGTFMVSIPSDKSVAERVTAATPAIQIPVLASRWVVLPFGGAQAAYQAGKIMLKASPSQDHPRSWIWINAVSLALITGFCVLLFRNRMSNTGGLVGAAAWLAVLSQVTGVGQDEVLMLFPLWNMRYYYAPISLILLALLEQAQPRGRYWMSLILVCLALLQGVWSYRAFHYRSDVWPKWEDEVARWRLDPTYLLPVVPPHRQEIIPFRLNPRSPAERNRPDKVDSSRSSPQAP
jgi:hypothetical protein